MIVSDATPPRSKLYLSKMNDELALDALSMLPLEVQTDTATFYKYLTDRLKTFMKSSDSDDVFATMVS